MSNYLNYYVLIDAEHRSNLSALRQWTNLKVAFDEKKIWITNFDLVQIESVEVKSIPLKSVFYSKNGKLFLQNSLLPDRNEPSFLWTPIQRAFPVRIEKLNHNYFGIHEELSFKLVQIEEEKKAEVMLIPLNALDQYISIAPEIRLKNIEWIIINEKDALLFGTPLLPLDGKVFWKDNRSILPVGYNFDLHILSLLIAKKINPKKDSYIIWNEDSSYYLVEKDLIMPLNLGSFRKSLISYKVKK